MPVAAGPRMTTRRAIVFGAASLVMGVGLVLLVIWIAGSGDVDVRLGDDRFQDLDAESMAEQIDDGGPLLFADAANGDRDIIIQHVGNDVDSGWYAFDARIPGQPRDCFLRWEADTEQFVDSCDDTLRIDATGGTLPHYPVTVTEGGELIVDLQTVIDE